MLGALTSVLIDGDDGDGGDVGRGSPGGGGQGRPKPPVTNSNGGTSVGDPSAGGEYSRSRTAAFRPLTMWDRAGAMLVSVGLLFVNLLVCFWMITSIGERGDTQAAG